MQHPDVRFVEAVYLCKVCVCYIHAAVSHWSHIMCISMAIPSHLLTSSEKGPSFNSLINCISYQSWRFAAWVESQKSMPITTVVLSPAGSSSVRTEGESVKHLE